MSRVDKFNTRERSLADPLPVSTEDLTSETDIVIVLNAIACKLDVLIKYQALLHGIELGD